MCSWSRELGHRLVWWNFLSHLVFFLLPNFVKLQSLVASSVCSELSLTGKRNVLGIIIMLSYVHVAGYNHKFIS